MSTAHTTTPTSTQPLKEWNPTQNKRDQFGLEVNAFVLNVLRLDYGDYLKRVRDMTPEERDLAVLRGDIQKNGKQRSNEVYYPMVLRKFPGVGRYEPESFKKKLYEKLDNGKRAGEGRKRNHKAAQTAANDQRSEIVEGPSNDVHVAEEEPLVHGSGFAGHSTDSLNLDSDPMTSERTRMVTVSLTARLQENGTIALDLRTDGLNAMGKPVAEPTFLLSNVQIQTWAKAQLDHMNSCAITGKLEIPGPQIKPKSFDDVAVPPGEGVHDIDSSKVESPGSRKRKLTGELEDTLNTKKFKARSTPPTSTRSQPTLLHADPMIRLRKIHHRRYIVPEDLHKLNIVFEQPCIELPPGYSWDDEYYVTFEQRSVFERTFKTELALDRLVPEQGSARQRA
ncbi:hypothetical protein MIND_00289400 [Mycena indigotica]|uniref:Uncharacterized protein n=1 Tax=Mycena indigotica TaxID=2126181 RepID=A0A8H6WHS3_9AGAR|nr:uncharacterized protein MIND_00289400 [Mycena indigotica]KAF7312744.1 hypothetical protein MIND_00289400 [Mycena indigotica]